MTDGPTRRDVDELEIDAIFIRTRTALHLAQRTGTRINQLISPFWADRTPAHRAATVALGVVDLAIARTLRTDPRLHLRWRLPLDAAELALAYAAAVRDDYDEASVPSVMGCPLAVEAGARLGWKGLVVPAVNLTVGTVVRRTRGHAPRTGTMAWQVAATVGGMGIAAYARRRQRSAVEQHRRERIALENRAELEGRHDIALGRGVVFDEIQRAAALIDLTLRSPRPSNPAGVWKAELAETTRGAFSYAGDVLGGWQARHNTTSPDLRTVVRLDLPAGQAHTILARTQADELEAALDRADLRGTVAVEVHSRRDAVEVVLPERRVVLAVPLGHPRIAFDPVPGAFLWSALWLWVAGAAGREHVPRWAAAGPAAVAVAMAVGSHRLGARHAGRASRPVVTAWSAGLTLASTALHTRTMRNTHGHGDISRYPYSLALRGFGLVALLAWSELDGRHRVGTAAAAAATVAMAWQLSPEPRSGRELIAELAWPLQSVALGGSLIASIDDEANRLGGEMRADDLRALEQARAKGRVDTIDVAARCLADAETALGDCVADLPPDIATEVRRRLAACHRHVEVLERRHGADRAGHAVGA
ncbi:MAG: hypothetical protein ACXIVQ_09340 [Acidimicrobiales bacterium]